MGAFDKALEKISQPGAPSLNKWREEIQRARELGIRTAGVHGDIWRNQLMQAEEPRLKQSSRAFSGAQAGRLQSSWKATQVAINQELRGDLDRLRARSRELEHNNDYAANYLDKVETNIAGQCKLQSLVDISQDKPDEEARKAIEDAHAEWGAFGVCEASGDYSFDDVCKTLARGSGRDGEILVREIRGPAAGNRFGYALQLLDVSRLATWLNRLPSEGVNEIIMGVECDKFGRSVAFHVNKSDRGATGGQTRGTERILATEMIHRFVVRRAGQKRGIPWMHASMMSMHYTGEFAISALLNAKAGSDRFGFFVSPDGRPPASAAEGEEDDEDFATSVTGYYDTLPEGYDFKQVNNPYPNDVFGPFIKVGNQRTAAGLHVSYPSLCNDFEAVNFSSIRVARGEEIDHWKKRQGWFVNILRTFFDHWLEMALANGAIVTSSGKTLPLSKISAYRKHGWQMRGWTWIDPVKDQEANQAAVDQGQSSYTRNASMIGENFEENIKQRARDEALAEQYGVTLGSVKASTPARADVNSNTNSANADGGQQP